MQLYRYVIQSYDTRDRLWYAVTRCNVITNSCSVRVADMQLFISSLH